MAALLRMAPPRMAVDPAPTDLEERAQPVAFTRTRKWILVAATLMLLPAALVTYRKVGWAQFGGSVKPITIDAAHPDAMIRTRSLSALPHDLLKIPLAHDLLTEDFVFYYEQHPDRLG